MPNLHLLTCCALPHLRSSLHSQAGVPLPTDGDRPWAGWVVRCC
ncbi:hypothetical protein [Thermoleptolyngbya sp.]